MRIYTYNLVINDVVRDDLGGYVFAVGEAALPFEADSKAFVNLGDLVAEVEPIEVIARPEDDVDIPALSCK